MDLRELVRRSVLTILSPSSDQRGYEEVTTAEERTPQLEATVDRILRALATDDHDTSYFAGGVYGGYGDWTTAAVAVENDNDWEAISALVWPPRRALAVICGVKLVDSLGKYRRRCKLVCGLKHTPRRTTATRNT